MPAHPQRVLLADGSGLTSRQIAALLGRAGHHVEVLLAEGPSLTRHSHWVKAVHRVPPFGRDPLGWFDALLEILGSTDVDLLLPVQEETAMLSCGAERVRRTGVRLDVPPFAGLRQVQDKVSAFHTLASLGIAQPPAAVAADRDALGATTAFPAFVKAPIGTAGTGVHRVGSPAGMRALGAALDREAGFGSGGVLVQQAVDGPVVMAVAVFDRGRRVAAHTALRVDVTANGGAIRKRSVRLPGLIADLDRLGRALDWHGPLSVDAVLGTDGAQIIDVNPRLVEPGNAVRAGVDIPAALLELGSDRPAEPLGRADVLTHQLLLGLINASLRGRGAVLGELARATLHLPPYRGSAEELTPLRSDLPATLMIGSIAAGLVRRPARGVAMGAGSVRNYALDDAGWRAICEAWDAAAPTPA